MQKTYLILLSLLAYLLLPSLAVAYFAQDQNSTFIRGTIEQPTADSVYIDDVAVALHPSGSFTHRMAVDTIRYLNFRLGDIRLQLYAEPEADVVLSFNTDKLATSLEFSGKNAAINRFLFNQRTVSNSFNRYFNKNINTYLSQLPEAAYRQKLDSLENTFLQPLQALPNKYADYKANYRKEIQLLFLSFLADYPLLHQKNSGQFVSLSREVRARLSTINLNDPQLQQFSGGKRLMNTFLYQETKKEMTSPLYSGSDNKKLDAGFVVIQRHFTQKEVFEKVLFDFFLNHIENLGIKNIEGRLAEFNSLITNPGYIDRINKEYRQAKAKREGHLIRAYKTIDGYTLDAHIFLPDSMQEGKTYPARVRFHGGSFYEGKPDWFFESSKALANKGWVVVAAEYRIADRHASLLPDAIADGKSLIRFLRQHAAEYQINPDKIMASGNSAGATIALALATLDETLDEAEEDHSISSRPNAIMINAGLADLTGEGHTWWHQYFDDEFIERISPLHQLEKGLPPMFIAHGTQDNDVNIESVRLYAEKAKGLGNEVMFLELKGAPHPIWRIPYFAKQINAGRREFLDQLNW